MWGGGKQRISFLCNDAATINGLVKTFLMWYQKWGLLNGLVEAWFGMFAGAGSRLGPV
jgi:hypothetical protein